MEKFISERKDISTTVSESQAHESELITDQDTEKVNEITSSSVLETTETLSDNLTEENEENTTDSQILPGKSTLSKMQDLSQKNSNISEWINRWIWKFPDGKKPLYRRYLFWLGVTIGSGAIAYSWALTSLDRTLPDTSDVFSFVRDGTLTIKSSDGTILQQTGPATREKLELKQIPPALVKAFIAIEDRRFYQHGGVDYQGIIRALVSNIIAKDVQQGGSTITQQVARIVFLDQERSILRKVKEARLAQKLEQKINKEQVLERYLNLVYLGSGAYGVADAAWVYFSKEVDKLSLAEMATIAGLPPAPSEYSPLVNPEIARERRNIVLQRMLEEGFITAEEASVAKATPLTIKASPPKRLSLEAPYFTSYVQQQLPKFVAPEVIEMGGLTVKTTLNLAWQKHAEKVIKNAVENDGAGQGFEQAALVAIDPRNGEVKAMVGGNDFEKSHFNRTTQAQRQPGSTFKTFVYTTAIAAGKSPYDSYADEPIKVDGYQPQNYGKKYRGWVSLADALSSSVNIVAVKVLIDVGFQPTIKMAKDMGIKSELKPFYSLALGGTEVNLLELTNAYGTLATQGKYTEAHGITRVFNKHGKVIYEANFEPKQVVDKGSAAIMTWMLEGVVKNGTGGPAQLGDRPVAGKTGTSEQARDLWFIGYIPQMVTGVWLGNDDNYPTFGSSGTAAFTWHEFMETATKEMPIEKFPKLPELNDRKGSIKAKPVTPNSFITGAAAGPQNPTEANPNTSGNYQQDYNPNPPQQQDYNPPPQDYNSPPDSPPQDSNSPPPESGANYDAPPSN